MRSLEDGQEHQRPLPGFIKVPSPLRATYRAFGIPFLCYQIFSGSRWTYPGSYAHRLRDIVFGHAYREKHDSRTGSRTTTTGNGMIYLPYRKSRFQQAKASPH